MRYCPNHPNHYIYVGLDGWTEMPRNSLRLAERFLFVVGATYIYDGTNNKQESANKKQGNELTLL